MYSNANQDICFIIDFCARNMTPIQMFISCRFHVVSMFPSSEISLLLKMSFILSSIAWNHQFGGQENSLFRLSHCFLSLIEYDRGRVAFKREAPFIIGRGGGGSEYPVSD